MYLPACFEKSYQLKLYSVGWICSHVPSILFLLLRPSHPFSWLLWPFKLTFLFSNLYFNISFLIETLIQLMTGHCHFQFHKEPLPFPTPCRLVQKSSCHLMVLPYCHNRSKSPPSPILFRVTCQLLPLSWIIFFCNLFLMVFFVSFNRQLYHCWDWPPCFPLPGVPSFSPFFS